MFLGASLPYMLAAVGADGHLRVWHTLKAEVLAQVQASRRPGDAVVVVAVSPVHMRLATGDAAGYLTVWDITGLRDLAGGGSPRRPKAVSCCAGSCMALSGLPYYTCIRLSCPHAQE